MIKKYLQRVEIINFYGENIFTGVCSNTGQVMVPLKQIIHDHLGMNWKKFKKKMGDHVEVLGDNSLYTPSVSTLVASDLLEAAEALAGSQEVGDDTVPHLSPAAVAYNLRTAPDEIDYVCVPLTEVTLLLTQINPVNIPDEDRRIKLVTYQKHCQRVLHDYWFYGAAVNNNVNPSNITGGKTPDEQSPRHWTSIRMDRMADRYARWCSEQGLHGIDKQDILAYCTDSICSILDIGAEQWENQDGYLEFLISFMERSASDILALCVENVIYPEDLSEALTVNIEHTWSNMGSLVLNTNPPYDLFPGSGRGATRELLRP